MTRGLPLLKIILRLLALLCGEPNIVLSHGESLPTALVDFPTMCEGKHETALNSIGYIMAWVPVDGYLDVEVNSLGEVRRNGRIIRQFKRGKYHTVNVRADDGRWTTASVHVLVCSAGCSAREVALLYGVSEKQVRNIVKFLRWKHVR